MRNRDVRSSANSVRYGSQAISAVKPLLYISVGFSLCVLISLGFNILIRDVYRIFVPVIGAAFTPPIMHQFNPFL